MPDLTTDLPPLRSDFAEAARLRATSSATPDHERRYWRQAAKFLRFTTDDADGGLTPRQVQWLARLKTQLKISALAVSYDRSPLWDDEAGAVSMPSARVLPRGLGPDLIFQPVPRDPYWSGLIWFCGCGRTTDFYRAVPPHACASCGLRPEPCPWVDHHPPGRQYSFIGQ